MRKIIMYNEFLNKDITQIIIEELKKWSENPCDINAGECYTFADNLESTLIENGYKPKFMSTDLFYELTKHLKYTEFSWHDPSDYNSKTPENFNWSENSYHAWIWVNGKHYDAEEVNGVENFFDLPIFKRFTK